MRTFAVAAAGLLALAPAAAHAQAATDAARGRELRLAGHPAEAAALLERAVQAAPQDADVWLDLGLAYAADHRYDQADDALARALALAPDYADVRLARARVAFFRRDLTEAERRLAPLRAAHPENADAAELARQIAAARTESGHAWRLDASWGRASLSKGLPDAADATLALTRRLDDGRAVSASAEHVDQFGRSDLYLELLGATRLGYLAVGGAPDADFRPEITLRVGVSGVSWPVGERWRVRLGADAAWARYPVGEVKALHPVLTFERGDDLRLQARWINVLDERDEHQGGYALAADWRAAPRLRLSAGWADAPESSDGVTTKVQAVGLGAAVDLSERLTLRLAGAHERRPAYDRDQVTVAVTSRF